MCPHPSFPQFLGIGPCMSVCIGCQKLTRYRVCCLQSRWNASWASHHSQNWSWKRCILGARPCLCLFRRVRRRSYRTRKMKNSYFGTCKCNLWSTMPPLTDYFEEHYRSHFYKRTCTLSSCLFEFWFCRKWASLSWNSLRSRRKVSAASIYYQTTKLTPYSIRQIPGNFCKIRVVKANRLRFRL